MPGSAARDAGAAVFAEAATNGPAPVLVAELDRIIDGDRYGFSPARIRALRELRAVLKPYPERPPWAAPQKQYQPPSRCALSRQGQLLAGGIEAQPLGQAVEQERLPKVASNAASRRAMVGSVNPSARPGTHRALPGSGEDTRTSSQSITPRLDRGD